MASEVSVNSCQFSVSKGGASIGTGALSKILDMTGTDMATSTQAVGTSAEVLNTPADVSFPAHIVIKNNDATNFVTVYQDSGGLYAMSKIVPGDWAKFAALGAVPYVKADTAACQIQWWASEV